LGVGASAEPVETRMARVVKKEWNEVKNFKRSGWEKKEGELSEGQTRRSRVNKRQAAAVEGGEECRS
jgi:hypothetical protein